MIKKSISPEAEFSINFYKGDLHFLKFVLEKYKDGLGYKDFFIHWIQLENNSRSICRSWAASNGFSSRAIDVWNRKGRVPPRIINLLHKDLMILRQKDPTIPTIEELFEGWKNRKLG